MPQATRRPPSSRAAAQKRSKRSRAISRRTARAWWQSPTLLGGTAVGIVVIVLIVIVVASQGGSQSQAVNADVRNPVPASVLTAVTQPNQTVLSQVGAGSSAPTDKVLRLPGATTLTDSTGKPLIVYVGAEYCPYCAAERWSLTMALARFGSFNGLQTTLSSSTDVFPNTNTFTFLNATYSSSSIAFQPSEIENRAQQALQTPSAQALQQYQNFDKPPYTSQAGAFPFVDIAGRYTLGGAGFSPQVLQGLSWSQIANELGNPSSPVTQAIVGNANVLTAAICTATSNQSQSVCSAPYIQGIEPALNALQPPS